MSRLLGRMAAFDWALGEDLDLGLGCGKDEVQEDCGRGREPLQRGHPHCEREGPV